MKYYFLSLLFFPAFLIAQETTILEGLPSDLDKEKIIFFQHEPIEITADKKGKKAERYLYLRQSNHNSIIEEANKKLVGSALSYPYGYAISTKSTYEALLGAGYKYILDSRAYKYENLQDQPDEGELIVYEYFIRNIEDDIAYKVFDLDEMKIYDSALLIKKLNKAIKKAD